MLPWAAMKCSRQTATIDDPSLMSRMFRRVAIVRNAQCNGGAWSVPSGRHRTTDTGTQELNGFEPLRQVAAMTEVGE